MSTFSITSPRFTADDEARECATLSEMERLQIESDVMGVDCLFQTGVSLETDEILARSTVQVFDAIELVPDSEKRSYQRACYICPDIVAQDSEPIRFLRATMPPFNTWDAALCIVKYWALRERLFGENAFSSLLSALSSDAVTLLNSGIISRLPDDKNRRVVVYVDRSRFEPTKIFRQSFLEMLFYILHTVIAKSETAQKRGIVVVAKVSAVNIPKFDRKLSKECFGMLRGDNMPVRINVIHACLMNMKPPFDLALPVVKHIAGKRVRRRLRVHHGCTEFILTSLESYGLLRKNVPTDLEGSWSVAEHHSAWLNELLSSDVRPGQPDT